jgi:AraC-like DNA-binding protein
VIERASTKPVLPAAALVSRAKAYIAAHGCERIDVMDVVGHLGVSRRLAELRFRQMEGKSLRQALEDRRIEEVKRLLAKTRLSVTAIAERTGFSGQNRLCHVFTERVGVSPSLYRASRESNLAGTHPARTL